MQTHTANYKVRVSDAGADGKLKLPALLQMLQEIATEHAEILKVDFDTLRPQGLGWALSKIAAEIEKLPRWGDRVEIETWASDKDRIATYREFTARDLNSGEPLFKARSQWLLFDFDKRRLARTERIDDFPRIAGRYAFDYDFSERPAAPSPDAPNAVACNAGICDIDLNGHVNNAVYMEWALDALPDMPAAAPAGFAVNFLEEVRPHAQVLSFCEVRGGVSAHSIRAQSTGHECARVNICWK